jgi:hypothetical protein
MTWRPSPAWPYDGNPYEVRTGQFRDAVLAVLTLHRSCGDLRADGYTPIGADGACIVCGGPWPCLTYVALPDDHLRAAVRAAAMLAA